MKTRNFNKVTVLFFIYTFALCVILAAITCKQTTITDLNAVSEKNNYGSPEKELRAVWVATVFGLDFPSSKTTNDTKLKNEIDGIIYNAKELGLNTVIFQVRPAADAFYKSNVFPWSKYLSGKQGTAPLNGFDPLKYFVEQTHKNSLELHAWLNPYRVTASPDDTLIPGHVALSNSEFVVRHADGKLYFNPGVPEVRQLIVDGVNEIVLNYDVDAIHFDDYFYPDGGIDDQDAYEKYNPLKLGRNDWRRKNNDDLIQSVKQNISLLNDKVKFGISPTGIWANKSSHPLGSSTNGYESYTRLFADTRKWVTEEWIDYISPQIYWHIGYQAADYKVVLNWWSNVCEGTGVSLFPGMAAYKMNDPSSNPAWYGSGEIISQIALNRITENVCGMIFFRYQDLLFNGELNATLRNQFVKYDFDLLLDSLPDLTMLQLKDKEAVAAANDFYSNLSPVNKNLLDVKSVAFLQAAAETVIALENYSPDNHDAPDEPLESEVQTPEKIPEPELQTQPEKIPEQELQTQDEPPEFKLQTQDEAQSAPDSKKNGVIWIILIAAVVLSAAYVLFKFLKKWSRNNN